MSDNLLKPSVLVVEDEPTNALIAETICRRAGFEVEAVSNGAEALARLEARRFDVALVDVQMPVLDGLDFARAVRAHPDWRRMPLVAVTARAGVNDHREIREAGIEAIVTKPYHNAALKAAIVEALVKAGWDV